MLLFKYVGPHSVKLAFAEDRTVTLKFAFPKDYNDPYELFLQTGHLKTQEQRAFYKFFLDNSIGMFPVTCFSRRPESVVMWAHYARSGTGACLAFEEDALVKHFPIAYIGDVRYVENAAQVDPAIVEFAATTLKARHAERLLNIGHGAAYFTKRKDWEYEAERRIVVEQTSLQSIDSGLFARVPMSALRYIILGPRSENDLDDFCRSIAYTNDVRLLRIKMGTRCYQPFFIEKNSNTMFWNGNVFESAANVCSLCGEPGTINVEEECDMCAISDEEAATVGKRSQLALAASFGLRSIKIRFDGAEAKGFKVREN